MLRRVFLPALVVLWLASAALAAEPPLVIFLGDSLSAGYGLPERQAFPALIERRLAERGTPIRMVNAGVSGDTTAGGLARLPWLLKQKPAVVVIELGANDGLRGQPVESIEKNLRAIVAKVKEAGAKPLLVEMVLPPSYGLGYAKGFTALYGRIADDLDVPLVAEFLRGVGGIADLNQPDGIHPTAAGHERLAETVTPVLEAVLAE